MTNNLEGVLLFASITFDFVTVSIGSPILFNSTSYITDFDVPMTKKLLEEIICKMEDNGFIIHGASFDCGNQTLIKDCGMSSRGEFSFPNPRDPNRNVYLFPGMFENKNIISSIILSSI